jgi:PAS domain S-box-containing protein
MMKDLSSKGSEGLGKGAEDSQKSEVERPDDMSLEDSNSLIHELRVHRIELEMQNEELRRAQDDLEISRLRYVALYDLAPVGYLTLNEQGQIIDLNLTAATQIGIERGSLIDRHFQYFVFQPDKKAFLDHLFAVFHKRERQITEVRLSPENGEQFYARLESIYMEGENCAGLCRTSMSDITLCNKAEQKAIQLASIVESSGDAIIGKNPDGIITSWNKGAEKVYGYTEREVIGKPISILIPPGHEDEVPRILGKIKSGEHIEHYETVRRRKDGQYIFMSLAVSPVRNADGRIVGASTIGHDITERKRLEKTLREGEQKYRTLFESMTQGVFYQQADGIITDINAAALEIFGLTSGDVLDRTSFKPSWEVIHEDGSPISPENHPSMVALKTGKPVRDAIAGIFNPQKKVHAWVVINAIPQFLPGEKSPHQVFVTLHDISYRKKAEEDREAAVEFLRLVNLSRSQEEMVRGALTFFQQQSGCEAVGIRLREGDDYPYYETRGFPREFVLAEKSLCRLDGKGQPIRDSAGNPVLECMCGNIICGRFDPSKSFFTPNGSFWSNNTTQLLASTSEVDRQARTRNRCNGEGYESVALIALRAGKETFGLLQFNDSRQGRFAAETIAQWERLAGYLAVALSKFRAEGALREGEEFKTAILDSMPSHIAVLDKNGVILSVNESWVRFSIENSNIEGFPPDRTGLGVNYLHVCLEGTGESSEGAMAAHDGILAVLEGTLPSFSFEYPCHSPGIKRWFTMTVTPLGTEQRGVVISHMNITERKRAEEALQEGEARLDLAIRSAHMGVWSWDIIEDKRHFDHQVCHLLGIDPATFTGKSEEFFRAVHPDDHEAIRTALYRVLTEDVLYDTEYRAVWSDGSVHNITARGRVLRDEAGRPKEITGIVWDVTERKRLEEERERVEAQLRQAQKMESLGTLAGGIAHDFNNILAIIMGYTQMLLMTKDEGSDEQEQLDEVFKATIRAKNLVQQILSFSRPSEEQKQSLQVSLIVKEALKMLRATLPSTIDVITNVTSNTVALADPTQMHQVLMNLCTNAAHAMRENGGTLEVSLTDAILKPEDIPSLPDLRPGPYVKLTVQDSGCGMSPAILDRIFDPFFTTKEKGVGTGLGLSVVHGIVKSHGGTIEVSSAPGAGTTFHVFLPSMKKARVTDATESSPLPRGRERVLVVDDEPALAQATKKMLARVGYQVDFRTNGIEALEAFRNQPEQKRYDLVITDMTMPHVTGIDLAKALFKLDPNLAIILCTGFSENIDAEKANRIGIQGFLMKPVILKELAGMVRKVLDEKMK